MGQYFKRNAKAVFLSTLLTLAANQVMAQTRAVQASTLTPERVQAASENALRFHIGIFDPLDEHISVSGMNLPAVIGGDAHLIQFHGPADRYRMDLDVLGIEVIGYIPANAYVVRMNSRQRSELLNQRADIVRFISPYRPQWKLSSQLLDLDPHVRPFLLPGDRVSRSDGLGLEISGFRGSQQDVIEGVVGKFNDSAVILDSMTHRERPRVRLWVPRSSARGLIEKLTSVGDIGFIAPHHPDQVNNRDSVEPIQRNAAGSGLPTNTPIWDQGLIGSGQIVAVGDSGLDRNEDWFVGYDDGSGPDITIVDSDMPVPPATGMTNPDSKVYAYWVQPGSTAYDNNVSCGGTAPPTGYHGTHVTGTVAGDALTRSTPTNPNYDDGDGMAPNAQVLFQDIGNDSSGCLSITNLGTTLEQARNGGAFIHSNSWGASVGGQYTSNSALLDQFAWEFEDHLVLFSAGNSGPGGTTIGAPATAKNALTVGALGHGNSTTAAGFSSRGPTVDGRLKPDIQAPGSSIRSARGDTNNGSTVETGLLSTKSGTSMSTPTTAGAAALMRQYFSDGFYPTGSATPADSRMPSGALMKAMLINGALQAPSFGVPSNTYGWGRVWLDNNLYFSGDGNYARVWDVPHSAGLSTGETDTYTVSTEPGQEIRVTLVWNDPPAEPAAATTLINDLDLSVFESGRSDIFRGNNFENGVSVAGRGTDTINNVEQVTLPAPAFTTNYTIQVTGSAVPGDGQNFSDTQGYALVVSSAASLNPLNVPNPVTATDMGATGIEVTIDTGRSTQGNFQFNVYRAEGDCTAAPLDYRLIRNTGNLTFIDDEVTGGFTYSYIIRQYDDNSEGPASSCVAASVATSSAVCNLIPDFDQSSVSGGDAVGDQCATTLNWTAASPVCPSGTVSYNIYRDTDPFFVPGPGNRIETGITDTSYTDSTVSSQTYYYVVRAVDVAEAPGDTRVKATPFADFNVNGDFTDGADGLSLLQLAGPWSVSDNQAATGTLSYRNAPDSATVYSPNTCAAITTPAIDLQQGNPALNYAARFNIEADWDGIVVEISTDGGNNWLDLPPGGGYPNDFSSTGNPPINACGYPASQGAFNGNTGGAFNNYSSDLSAYAGQTVMIRWVMSTDPGSEEEGFYLDDAVITNASTPAICGSMNPVIFADGFEN